MANDLCHPHRFNRDEYYRMGEAGLFQDRRVQLVEGVIIDMPPQENAHAMAIEFINRALRKGFGDDFWIRIRLPLHLGEYSEPDPDIAVVLGNPRGRRDHPETAALAVEVSDTTLQMDRTQKARLYAQAAIGDYWIINLVARQIEIHRNPQLDTATGEYRYGDIRVAEANEFLSPLSAQFAKIAVADLLP